MLSSWVDRKALKMLKDEPGFMPPNEFPVENLFEVLTTKEFPLANVGDDYVWSIYESELQYFEKFQPGVRVFVSSVALYCFRLSNCIGALDEIFTFHIVSSAIKENRFRRNSCCDFLAWLPLTSKIDRADQSNRDVFIRIGEFILRSTLGQKGSIDDLSSILNDTLELPLGLESNVSGLENRWSKLVEDNSSMCEEHKTLFVEIVSVSDL